MKNKATTFNTYEDITCGKCKKMLQVITTGTYKPEMCTCGNDKEHFFYYYAKIVRIIKEVVEDDDLTDEEKIRILGTIL